MLKTINNNWLTLFKKELVDSQELIIVSPFITDNIAKQLLLNFKGTSIKLITRYNLNEFKRGVSSLSAIERLLKSNVHFVYKMRTSLQRFLKFSFLWTDRWTDIRAK